MIRLKFRPIAWADAGPLFVWRHDEDTAIASFKPPPTWEQHLAWLNTELLDCNTFVGSSRHGLPVVAVGVVNNEINIMVHPGLRRQGFAKQALTWAQANWDWLSARIKLGNTAGLKLFATCGFEIIEADTSDNYITMRWEGKP